LTVAALGEAIDGLGVGPCPPGGRVRRDSQRPDAPGEGRKSSQILRRSPSFEASPYRSRASRPVPGGEGDFSCPGIVHSVRGPPAV